MEPRLTFHLEPHQEPHLAPNARQLHALLTITARTLDAAAVAGGAAPPAAVVIIVDSSGSMGEPAARFATAIRAASAAVDTLQDGTWFAVIRGTERAQVWYPAGTGMALADADSKAAAKRALSGITPGGATNLSRWLELARELLAEHPSAIRHAVLLTDGWNEPGDRLEQTLASCARSFTCDLRGVGDGWNPKDLQRIASALHGTADAAAADADLVDQVREVIQAAMQKAVTGIRLRIHTAAFARVHFLTQVQPELDLTEHATVIGDRTREFSIGSWGAERRVYHLCLVVAPDRAAAEEDLRAARLDIVSGSGRLAGPKLVLAHWTNQLEPVSEISMVISDSQKYADLRSAIDAGCEAYLAGDHESAERAWGEAVQLANQLGDLAATEQLGSVVDIVDAERAVVRVRAGLSQRDVKILAIRPPHTSVSAPPDELDRLDRPVVTAPNRRCQCGRLSPPDAVFCQQCRRRFDSRPEGGE